MSVLYFFGKYAYLLSEDQIEQLSVYTAFVFDEKVKLLQSFNTTTSIHSMII